MAEFHMTETEIRFRDHVVVTVDASHVPASVIESTRRRHLPLTCIGDEIWADGQWRIGKLVPTAQPSIMDAFLFNIDRARSKF